MKFKIEKICKPTPWRRVKESGPIDVVNIWLASNDLSDMNGADIYLAIKNEGHDVSRSYVYRTLKNKNIAYNSIGERRRDRLNTAVALVESGLSISEAITYSYPKRPDNYREICRQISGAL